jgi:CheY-like chemotaxis protein
MTKPTIIHELIKPLNTILGFTQLLSNDSTLKSEHQEMIAQIHNSGEKLLSQIHEIFDIAKNETKISITDKAIHPLELNKSIHILVVDDDKPNQFIIENILSKYKLIKIHEASHAQSAIDQILEIQPQIVILDIHLPDMDGFEIIQRTRKNAQNIIFIMMSSDPQSLHEEQLTSCDVKAYLPKPIQKKNLITLLKKFTSLSFDDQQETQLPVVSQPDKLPDEHFLKEIIRLAHQGAYSEIKNLMEQLKTKQSEFMAFVRYVEQLLRKFQFNEIIDWINAYRTKVD